MKGLQLVVLVEQVCFSKNAKVWEWYLQSHDYMRGQIGFNQVEFQENRYGVNITRVKLETRQASAASVLSRAVKRWIIRKRIKEELRRPGYKYQSGVIRMLGLQLVYVMMNHDD